MLGIKGEPGYGTVTGQRVGDKLPVDLDRHRRSRAVRTPRTTPTAVFRQGRNKGGAKFLVRRGLHVPRRVGRVRLVGRRRRRARPDLGVHADRRTSARRMKRASWCCSTSPRDKLHARRAGQHVHVARAARSSSSRTATIARTSSGRSCPTASMISFAENLVQVRLQLHRRVRQDLRPERAERRPRHRGRARGVGVRRARGSAPTGSGCS